MSEDSGQGADQQPPAQPQFNPQSGYPVGDQPPAPPAAPPAYPSAGAPNPYVGYTAPQQPAWAPQQPGLPPFPVYAVPDLPKATTALVLGIVAIAGAFLCVVPILAAPVAWVLGAQARKQIRSAPQQWGGEGRATAGMVLGIIGTVLLVLGLIAVTILVVVAVTGTTTTDGNTGV
jgi:hypothetical protein